MDINNLSFSEVGTYQYDSSQIREISLDMGANPSTLQDFKLAGSCGFFCYKESNLWSSACCNRFIHWWANQDCVEFIESSLDYNLANNHVKLRFRNTPVLERISIHETSDQVIILIATVASIHRLILPHPKKLSATIVDTTKASLIALKSQNLCLNSSDIITKSSIFFKLSSESLRNPSSYHVINNAFDSGNSPFSSEIPFPITSCSWINEEKEAYFILTGSSGNISVLKMCPHSGRVTTWDLKQTTIIGRLINNFVPSIISRTTNESEQAPLSIICLRNPLGEDDLIFALCKDIRIRMWSCSRQECIMDYDLAESFQDLNISDKNCSSNSFVMAQKPILKKVETQYPQDYIFFAAYISTNKVKQFFILKLITLNQLKLKLVTCIDALEEDLIDFVFTTTTIWSLWLNSKTGITVAHCEIQGGSQDWQTITLHASFLPSPSIKSLFVTPKKLFIEDIFKKGRFSMKTIAKAISALNRTSETKYFGYELNALINEAINVVENRMRAHCNLGDLAPEDYNKLEKEFWDEFHSYCIQYHNVANKPLGLLIDCRTGLVGIIRVSNISFIRSNDDIDHLILANTCYPHRSISNFLIEDVSIESSLKFLLDSIKLVSMCLPDEALFEFEMSMLKNESAQQAAINIVDNYLINALNICSSPNLPLKDTLSSIFTKAPRLLEAIDLILKSLNLDSKETFEDEMETLSTLPVQSDSFLSSNLGACILTENLKQICRLRYEFCRDFLFFQTFLFHLSNKRNINFDKLEDMGPNSISLNALYLHAYYFMTWVCETCMNSEDGHTNAIENTVSLLSILELHEYINVNRNESINSSIISDFSPKSILSHLILHKKCPIVRKMLNIRLSVIDDLASFQSWLYILPMLAQSLAQVIWPLSKSFHLPQFLLGFGQYELLDSYCELLNSWSQFNIYSRYFFKALVCLLKGDSKSSISYFHRALPGISHELFLQKTFQPQYFSEMSENMNSGSIIKSYYLKIIKLFELYSKSDAITEIASQAIDFLDETDPMFQDHLASLLAIMFTQHLEKGNTQEAYQAMILNPYSIQRKDCLRSFIRHLYDSKNISELISYNYNEMEEDFINILEFKARSSDVLHEDKQVGFYEILYAYFVNSNNYRRSASVIYEYAKRLSIEAYGLESLKRQSKCLALAMNSLHLVNPKYAWIVRPLLKTLEHEKKESNSLFKRKLEDGNLKDEIEVVSKSSLSKKREIQVIGIDDIMNEFELVNARARLLEKNDQVNAIASSPLSAEETISLLIGNLMFENAFRLSQLSKLPYEPVFEGIVGKYVRLTELPRSKANFEACLDEINDCFIENDTAALSFIANAEISVIEKVLLLIMAYLAKYEEDNQSRLHKCVAEKLLSSGIFLPSQLKLSYQKRNCPELLYLLMSYSFIQESVTLGLELIDGYFGKGTEYFNVKCMVGAKSPIYFPYQHFKCLLEILKIESKDNPEYKNHQKALEEKLNEYNSLRQSF